jgi:hypothetical protein
MKGLKEKASLSKYEVGDDNDVVVMMTWWVVTMARW